MPIDPKKCCGTHSKEKEETGECCQTKKKDNAEQWHRQLQLLHLTSAMILLYNVID